jgi:two-component system chemotaxis response regulator CheB
MNRDLIFIGASAGGHEPLIKIVAALPSDLQATLFVVMHTSPDNPGYLAEILQRSGKLPAIFPKGGEKFAHGTIYIAPPDRHLMVEAGRIRVIRGPRENRHRPAIDPLFRSAAVHCGARAVGIILSGLLDDGAAGLHTIQRCGGVAIVQEPRDALCASMPEHALRTVVADYCVPAHAIAKIIQRLSASRSASLPPSDHRPQIAIEAAIAAGDTEGEELLDKMGKRSTLTCPECHGALWEIADEGHFRFRCHIGHAYTAEILAAGQEEGVQTALSVAIRTLEDHALLTNKLARQAAERGSEISRKSFEKRSQEAARHASLLRRVLVKDEASVVPKKVE